MVEFTYTMDCGHSSRFVKDGVCRVCARTSGKIVEVRVITHTPDGPAVAVIIDPGDGEYMSSCWKGSFGSHQEAEAFAEGLRQGIKWMEKTEK